MPSDPTPSEVAETALTQALAGPARVSGDAGSVESHRLSDLIAADKHLKGQDAAGKPARGLRITRLLPPGTV